MESTVGNYRSDQSDLEKLKIWKIFKVIDGWHERQMSSGLDIQLNETDLSADNMNQLGKFS